MVSVIRRMNVLKRKLYNIRHGPGAAVLPPEVSRIHMEFPIKANPGQLGPRKFWRDNLPRLKYHNPAVPMLVNRTTAPDRQSAPPLLTVYVRDGAAAAAATGQAPPPPRTTAAAHDAGMMRSATDGSAPAPPPAEGERVFTIDMTERRSEDILDEFMARTAAQPVPPPSAVEERDMAELDALEAQAAVDREIVRAYREKERKEKDALDRVKREADEMRAASKEV